MFYLKEQAFCSSQRHQGIDNIQSVLPELNTPAKHLNIIELKKNASTIKGVCTYHSPKILNSLLQMQLVAQQYEKKKKKNNNKIF